MWKVYERDDLGKGESISQYAVVLLQWIMGSGLRYIVDGRIDYYNNKRWRQIIKINHKEEIYQATERQVDYLRESFSSSYPTTSLSFRMSTRNLQIRRASIMTGMSSSSSGLMNQ